MIKTNQPYEKQRQVNTKLINVVSLKDTFITTNHKRRNFSDK